MKKPKEALQDYALSIVSNCLDMEGLSLYPSFLIICLLFWSDVYTVPV